MSLSKMGSKGMSKRERVQSGLQEQAMLRAMAAMGGTPGVQLAPAFKQGWLEKRAQGVNRLGRANWKKRFFTLRVGMLRYYDHEPTNPKAECKGMIVLTKVRAIEEAADAFGRTNLLQVVHDDAVLYIQAASADDREDWLQCIRKMCSHNVNMLTHVCPGYYTGKKWTCCGSHSKTMPGCKPVSNVMFAAVVPPLGQLKGHLPAAVDADIGGAASANGEAKAADGGADDGAADAPTSGDVRHGTDEDTGRANDHDVAGAPDASAAASVSNDDIDDGAHAAVTSADADGASVAGTGSERASVHAWDEDDDDEELPELPSDDDDGGGGVPGLGSGAGGGVSAGLGLPPSTVASLQPPVGVVRSPPPRVNRAPPPGPPPSTRSSADAAHNHDASTGGPAAPPPAAAVAAVGAAAAAPGTPNGSPKPGMTTHERKAARAERVAARRSKKAAAAPADEPEPAPMPAAPVVVPTAAPAPTALPVAPSEVDTSPLLDAAMSGECLAELEGVLGKGPHAASQWAVAFGAFSAETHGYAPPAPKPFAEPGLRAVCAVLPVPGAPQGWYDATRLCRWLHGWASRESHPDVPLPAARAYRVLADEEESYLFTPEPHAFADGLGGSPRDHSMVPLATGAGGGGAGAAAPVAAAHLEGTTAGGGLGGNGSGDAQASGDDVAPVKTRGRVASDAGDHVDDAAVETFFAALRVGDDVAGGGAADDAASSLPLAPPPTATAASHHPHVPPPPPPASRRAHAPAPPPAAPPAAPPADSEDEEDELEFFRGH